MILLGVLPHAQLGVLEACSAVWSVHAAECLLPLVKVEHAILADVDGVEQILDDRVGGWLLSSKLVGLLDQLAEVSEGDTTILLKVKLYKNKKRVPPY